MTDPTYDAESHHTPESLNRDVRFVGHEVKADLVKRLRSLSGCDARAGEPLGKCMREAANRIEALEAEAEGAHAIIAAERAEVMKLREENERLLEAFCVNMLRHGYDHADIDDVLSVCYTLKGDSHD